MYTVMLADDNKLALEHFSGLVEWKKLGFSLVNTSVDGVEAWKNFRRYYPDLVITDVQMPGIDGRELARRIRRERPDTVIIFLSSYDEFDYARAAIDLSVQDYILKQELDEQGLERKLLEIRRLLTEREEKRKKHRKNHLMSLFHTPPEELDEDFYGEIFPESFGSFFVEQDHMPEPLAELLGCKDAEADFQKIIQQLLQQTEGLRYCVRVEEYRWLCLADPGGELEQVIDKVRECLKENDQYTFSEIILKNSGTVLECRKEYEEQQYVFLQRYFTGNNVVIYSDMCEKPENQRRKTEELEQLLQDPDRIFRPVIVRSDYDEFIRLLLEGCRELDRRGKRLYEGFQLYGVDEPPLTSARGIVRWLKSKIQELKELEEQKQSTGSEALARAVNYIYREYQNPSLSVEEIAVRAGLSVNRLNDLFKKERQETVGRFLTRVRLEKSRELLDKDNIRIPEIVNKVGYASTSYFARVFRKYFGMSPQEYRRRKRS